MSISSGEDLVSFSLKSGWLKKRSDVVRKWNSRWIEVDPVRHELFYFKERPAFQGARPRGKLSLLKAVVEESLDGRPERFVLRSQSQVYMLEAPSATDAADWVRCLRLTTTIASMEDALSSSLTGSSATMGDRKVLDDIESRAEDMRERLRAIASAKWQAKCRLKEKGAHVKLLQAELMDRRDALTDEVERLREHLDQLSTLTRQESHFVSASLRAQQLVTRVLAKHGPAKIADAVVELQHEVSQRAAQSTDTDREVYTAMSELLADWFPDPNTPDLQRPVDFGETAVLMFCTDFYENVHLPHEVEHQRLSGDRTQSFNALRRATTQKTIVNSEIGELQIIQIEVEEALHSGMSHSENPPPGHVLMIHQQTRDELQEVVKFLSVQRQLEVRISSNLEHMLHSRETVREFNERLSSN
ncbi:MAG: hypothetical protein MHM6MM_000057 [Cercozoa sp. M6MM]